MKKEEKIWINQLNCIKINKKDENRWIEEMEWDEIKYLLMVDEHDPQPDFGNFDVFKNSYMGID